MKLPWPAVAAVSLLALSGVVLPDESAASAGPGERQPAMVERVRVHDLGGGRYAEERLLVDPSQIDPDTLGVDPDASEPGGVSAQFLLWRKWDMAAIPVPVAYNGASEPAGLNGTAVLQDQLSTWSAVSGQTFRFAWAGPTTAGYGVCNDARVPDGVNSVSFGPTSSPGILGSTCSIIDEQTFTIAGQPHSIPGVAEFDLVINPKANWSSAPTPPLGKYDLPSTILHELGHALGLDHSKAAGSVMAPTLAAGKKVRKPTQDDVDGVRALYGDGSPQTPPPDPPPLPPLGFSLRLAAMAKDY